METEFKSAFNLLFPLLGALIVSGALPGTAFAQESAAQDPGSLQILNPRPGKSKIEALEWDPESISLEPEPGTDPKDNRWQVKVRGQYSNKNWNLLQGARKLPVDEKTGMFEAQLPVKGRTASARISGVSPLGVVESEELRISVPVLERVLASPPTPVLPGQEGTSIAERSKSGARRFFSQTSLGMTSLQYTETTRPDYSAIALTGRIGATYVLAPPRWELGLSSYGTLTWLSESAPDNIRFIGVNARVGYIIAPERSRWRFALVGGAYYTTTLVPGGAYGFQNMIGPQLYPNFRVTVGSTSSIGGYFKFSPVSAGFSLLSLANNEMAFGGSYTKDLGGGRSWGISLDIARISLKFTLVEISSQSATLGVNFGL